MGRLTVSASAIDHPAEGGDTVGRSLARVGKWQVDPFHRDVLAIAPVELTGGQSDAGLAADPFEEGEIVVQQPPQRPALAEEQAARLVALDLRQPRAPDQGPGIEGLVENLVHHHHVVSAGELGEVEIAPSRQRPAAGPHLPQGDDGFERAEAFRPGVEGKMAIGPGTRIGQGRGASSRRRQDAVRYRDAIRLEHSGFVRATINS